MYYRNIVLSEVTLFGKTCIMGGNVLQECMSSEWHIFQNNGSYWIACFTRGQVLFGAISYSKSCLTGIHVLQKYMFYMMAYLTG